MAPKYSLNASASSGPSYDPFKFRAAVNEAVFAEINQCNILRPWKICYDDAKTLGIRCFDQMKNAGLESLMDLEEDICPKIVKEFYSNLTFRGEDLKADFYLRGIKGTITEKFLANILGCAVYEHSIKIFDEINYNEYNNEKGCLSITGDKFKSADYENLDAESQILFHALCCILTPKHFKQVSPNPREVFYMWCIKTNLHLNTPFIILSHMRSFLRGEVQDIPYGMLITRIAKYSLVYISNQQRMLYTEVRNFYNSNFLRDRMGIEREDKVEEEEAFEAAPLIRKRRRLVVTESSSSSEETRLEYAHLSTKTPEARGMQDKGKAVIVEKDDNLMGTNEETDAGENVMASGFTTLSNQLKIMNQNLH